ncbi:kasugamycin N-acetyltransferase AAC(2')-IIb [Paenibacillus solani]|uniref:kasugamycin N-acetyltransferase AAC(2')-IIb n=1 Tax=Paenibacillus solani TaxID=1705565 RepID=UPI003D28FFC0
MNYWNEHEPIARDLMEQHVRAMFRHDDEMRIRTINEPWPGEKPAPRFFLGRAIDGSVVWRICHDVPEMLGGQLKALVESEPIVISNIQTKPKHYADYMSLLQADHNTSGPCYLISGQTRPTEQTVLITSDNIAGFSLSGFEWLIKEIDYDQPCVGLLQGNRIVSVCRSVRITTDAHEAGLETLDEFRGRGYAAIVVAGWAAEVYKKGALPLYSTSWENTSSQRVASKLELFCYGVNFTIW